MIRDWVIGKKASCLGRKRKEGPCLLTFSSSRQKDRGSMKLTRPLLQLSRATTTMQRRLREQNAVNSVLCRAIKTVRKAQLDTTSHQWGWSIACGTGIPDRPIRNRRSRWRRSSVWCVRLRWKRELQLGNVIVTLVRPKSIQHKLLHSWGRRVNSLKCSYLPLTQARVSKCHALSQLYPSWACKGVVRRNNITCRSLTLSHSEETQIGQRSQSSASTRLVR